MGIDEFQAALYGHSAIVRGEQKMIPFFDGGSVQCTAAGENAQVDKGLIPVPQGLAVQFGAADAVVGAGDQTGNRGITQGEYFLLRRCGNMGYGSDVQTLGNMQLPGLAVFQPSARTASGWKKPS